MEKYRLCGKRSEMSHKKREIKERSVKVEVVFSGNESIIR